MNPSMHRHNEILDVETAQAARLREGGVGTLLLWHEATDRVETAAPGHVPGEEAMIMAGVDDLGGLAEQAADNGEEFTDTYAAAMLGEVGGDDLSEWPRIKVLTPGVLELRTDMARRGFYLAARPDHQYGGRYTITDTYRSAQRPDLTILVSSAVMPTDPTAVTILATTGRRVIDRFGVLAGAERPGMAAYLVAGATGAAVEALPRM